MISNLALALTVACAATAGAANIPLVTFDGNSGTTHKFQELNDPVMGGKSTGTFAVTDGLGVFDGDVVDVPSLKAPGFIKCSARDGTFTDASSALDGDLVLTVRTSTPEYQGFRVTFAAGAFSPSFSCAAGGSIIGSRGCYKAKFSVPATKDGEFATVRIPFNTFSDKWSSATGEQTTTCAKDSDVCPTAKALSKIQAIEVWGEGKLGHLHLEIKSISAVSKGTLLRGDRPLQLTPLASIDTAAAAAAAAAATPLVTFDGADGTTHSFKTLNDPVMGGQSNGTFAVKDGLGVFDGNVNIVPKLKAPGFIEAWANDGHYNDASSALDGDLVLTVRTSTPEFQGFRVTFAAGAFSPSFSCAVGGSVIGGGGCYKAKFSVPATENGEFATVRIPFNTFSDKWSSATGEQTKTCAEDSSVCPTAKALSKIQAIGLWGEGKQGYLHLEVKSISAEPSAMRQVAAAVFEEDAPARPPSQYDTCSGPVQTGLRFNISTLTSSDLTAPVAVNPDESLATAICCDSRTKVYAEPRYLFQSPFVDLFKHLPADGTPTTFYDSVCGIPLFTAPMNRTLQEFQDDTNEHGWPSFRPAELIKENVRTDKDGFVYSKCGTHLGSFLPDEKGDRWCLDTACVAGHPPKQH